MTIAITGATGHLGRLVFRALDGKVDRARLVALVRSPAKAVDLGVAARAADYEKPATLAAALVGVDTLLLISSSEVGRRAEQHRNVIAAAAGAGVARIVYTSLLHADRSVLSLAAEHLRTERVLAESGITHTILRNGWYVENYTASIPAALANGALVGCAGHGRISWAARADYATAAATVVATSGHDGKTYELAGDTAGTLADLAAEISRQTGTPLPYRDLPEGEYAAILVRAGLPDGLARAIASWDVAAAHGALEENGRQLSTLIGRPTTPLTQAVAAALASR